jgi:hypothetical protein
MNCSIGLSTCLCSLKERLGYQVRGCDHENSDTLSVIC